jgi:hypothetical protein
MIGKFIGMNPGERGAMVHHNFPRPVLTQK